MLQPILLTCPSVGGHCASSTFRLLQTMPLWMWEHKYLVTFLLSTLLDIYLEGKSLDHMEILFSIFGGTTTVLSTALLHFTFPSMRKCLSFPTSLLTFAGFSTVAVSMGVSTAPSCLGSRVPTQWSYRELGSVKLRSPQGSNALNLCLSHSLVSTAWKVLWTEDLVGCSSWGCRVRHDWAAKCALSWAQSRHHLNSAPWTW